MPSKQVLPSLRQFLRNLSPGIEEVFPAFERNGVHDQEAVRVLAGFPEARRGIFLREDMGLNTFQFHKVTLALQSIVRLVLMSSFWGHCLTYAPTAAVGLCLTNIDVRSDVAKNLM